MRRQYHKKSEPQHCFRCHGSLSADRFATVLFSLYYFFVECLSVTRKHKDKRKQREQSHAGYNSNGDGQSIGNNSPERGHVFFFFRKQNALIPPDSILSENKRKPLFYGFYKSLEPIIRGKYRFDLDICAADIALAVRILVRMRQNGNGFRFVRFAAKASTAEKPFFRAGRLLDCFPAAVCMTERGSVIVLFVVTALSAGIQRVAACGTAGRDNGHGVFMLAGVFLGECDR